MRIWDINPEYLNRRLLKEIQSRAQCSDEGYLLSSTALNELMVDKI